MLALVALLALAEPRLTLLELPAPPKPLCTYESLTPRPGSAGEPGVWMSAAEAECLLWLVEKRLPALESGLNDYRMATDAYKALLATQTDSLRVSQEMVKTTAAYAADLHKVKEPSFFEGAEIWAPVGFVVGVATTCFIIWAVNRAEE